MRIFFVITEFVLLFLVVIFVLTQLLMPAIRGTATFPFFRREQRLKEDIFDAQQDLREDRLESMRDELREDANHQPHEGEPK